jgi:type I restriction enzyme M protein
MGGQPVLVDPQGSFILAQRDGVRAAALDAAVFDLKAVNPHALVKTDTRPPEEILANIEAQGCILNDALHRLRVLMA